MAAGSRSRCHKDIETSLRPLVLLPLVAPHPSPRFYRSSDGSRWLHSNDPRYYKCHVIPMVRVRPMRSSITSNFCADRSAKFYIGEVGEPVLNHHSHPSHRSRISTRQGTTRDSRHLISSVRKVRICG